MVSISQVDEEMAPMMTTTTTANTNKRVWGVSSSYSSSQHAPLNVCNCDVIHMCCYISSSAVRTSPTL